MTADHQPPDSPNPPENRAEESPDAVRREAEDRTRMPLWEHLDDLRRGLIRSLLAIGLGLLVTYNFSDHLMIFLERPLLDLLPPGEGLYFTGITDKFFIYLKVSVLAAIGLVSPWLLLELWWFISPALYREEKKFLVPFVFLGSIAFVLGLAFAYYLVIPYGYKFLLEFGSPTEKAIITLTEYFSLTLKMLLALGLVFEVPVLLILLGKFGIIDAALLKRNRRFAFVASSVIAAIATPSPDAFTMLLVMGPLYLLYESSIVGVYWVTRGEKNATSH